MKFVLSPKFEDFLKYDCKREYLEGTTAAGKTTVGVFKWMLKVMNSPIRDHLLTGLDSGTIEKNIINASMGITDLFPYVTTYYPNGKGSIRIPHIEFQATNGTKIIYVCGYGDKSKWKKVLGGQVGCVYIDEVNIADMEFLREVTHRCKYMMTTNNPDSPDLPVYKEFINHSRPLKKYEKDYPKELLDELNEPEVEGWVHWYFTFYDNASLTKQDIQDKIDAVPVGTKMYKNKILGLRGRATGLIFTPLKTTFITREDARKLKYTDFAIGVDTSYSKKTHDKLTVTAIGITTDRKCVVLMSRGKNNATAEHTFAPSDAISFIVSVAEDLKILYGFVRNIFIDNADSGTIREAEKYARETSSVYNFKACWKGMKIITRIQLQQMWMNDGSFLVVKEDCEGLCQEMNEYSYDENGQPEDGHDHYINGCQYAWMPFARKIGDYDKISSMVKDI